MENTYSITIKLKPGLQDFIRGQHGNPVVAGRRTFFGKLVQIFLQARPADLPPVFKTSPEYITVQLPFFEDMNIASGSMWIPQKEQVFLEQILDAYFKEIFLNYVNDKVRYTITTPHGRIVRRSRIKDAILQFCADYNMPYNSIHYESLKKRHYRNRRKCLPNDENISLMQ